jgi:hypothetical protein
MKKTMTLFGLLALAGAISGGAAAQEINSNTYAVKKALCIQQADEKNFGIHEYRRHQFVLRCIAGCLISVLVSRIFRR